MKKVYRSPIFECENVTADFLMSSGDVYSFDNEMIFETSGLYSDF